MGSEGDPHGSASPTAMPYWSGGGTREWGEAQVLLQEQKEPPRGVRAQVRTGWRHSATSPGLCPAASTTQVKRVLKPHHQRLSGSLLVDSQAQGRVPTERVSRNSAVSNAHWRPCNNAAPFESFDAPWLTTCSEPGPTLLLERSQGASKSLPPAAPTRRINSGHR